MPECEACSHNGRRTLSDVLACINCELEALHKSLSGPPKEEKGRMVDEYLEMLLRETKNRFPFAVSVNIHISAHEVTVTPEYRGEIDGYAMQTIGGQWCGVREARHD